MLDGGLEISSFAFYLRGLVENGCPFWVLLAGILAGTPWTSLGLLPSLGFTSPGFLRSFLLRTATVSHLNDVILIIWIILLIMIPDSNAS